MMTLKTVLIIALTAGWLLVAISLLVSTIQGILCERRRESREEEAARREREDNTRSMIRELEQIRQDSELLAKSMKSLE